MGDTAESLKAQLARVEAVLKDLLGEQRSSATPSWLLDEMLAWVKHADALHTFLQNSFIEYGGYDSEGPECLFCGGEGGGHRISHPDDVLHPPCELLLLWEKIDPERYQKTIDAMFEQFCRRQEYAESQERNAEIQRRRRGIVNIVGTPYLRDGEAYLFSQTPADRVEQISELLLDGHIDSVTARQILMSPNDEPAPQGLAAWLPARGILDKDGNDPNAQLFQIDKPIITK